MAGEIGVDLTLALSWSNAGDDGRCGRDAAYEVVGAGGEVLATTAGTDVVVSCAAGPVEVRAVDEAGQRGFPAPVPAGACPAAAAAAALAPAAPRALPATGTTEPPVALLLAIALLGLVAVRLRSEQ